MKVKENLKYIMIIPIALSLISCYSKYINNKGNITQNMTSKEKILLIQ